MTEYPSDPPKLDPVAIREALAGYAVANEVIEDERQRTLAHMTCEDALAAWRDLMKGFNERPEMRRNLDRLDMWQVEGLLIVRQALDRMAAEGKTR